MQSAQPPGGPPAYGGPVGQEAPYQGAVYQPVPGHPSGGWWAGAVIVALVCLAGGVAIGTIVERNKYEAGKPAYDAIFSAGYASGQGEGTYQGQKAGRKEGRRVGRKVGFQKGKTAGQKAGEIQGTADGASAALGGLTGWDPQSNYIVNVQDGPSAQVPFAISRRTEMVRGSSYSLCNNNPQQVCVRNKR